MKKSKEKVMAAYTCIERLSKNYHFRDSLYSDYADTNHPKAPIRNFSPSENNKTEVHAPGFICFADIISRRCRTAASTSFTQQKTDPFGSV